jgi:protein gp37
MKTIPDEFIDSAWKRMAQCPQHTFLVLTKRPKRMLRAMTDFIIPNYGILLNVWLGCTVVNQAEADEKIPIFLQVPGKKFLSLEPLLGPIDLVYPETLWPDGPQRCCDGRECGCMGLPIEPPLIYGIDAVILGGETGGYSSRLPNVSWVQSIRDQCESAGVPFFFKSWGKKGRANLGRLLDGRTHDDLPWNNPC